MANTQDERTRLQLHSTEISTSLIAVRLELEDARASASAARVAEEAGRQQLACMMVEQLAQTQTIEAPRRQVETSNNAARDAQALLRVTQDQQQQYLCMPPPSNLPTVDSIPGHATLLCVALSMELTKAEIGNIGNSPFIPPLSTPSTGLRTRELHGLGYYHVGSPADPGYAEQMRAMYGTAEREDIESLRYDPPRRDLQASGSSSQGSSSQSNQREVWQSGYPSISGQSDHSCSCDRCTGGCLSTDNTIRYGEGSETH